MSFSKFALCLFAVSVASIAMIVAEDTIREDSKPTRNPIIYPGYPLAIVKQSSGSNSKGVLCWTQYVPISSLPMGDTYLNMLQQITAPYQSMLEASGINPCMFLDLFAGGLSGSGSSSGSASSSGSGSASGSSSGSGRIPGLSSLLGNFS